jgi:hypothetical protein
MILHELVNNSVERREADPVFEKKYDLIVTGLGTAGAIALISAGRAGLSVLGLDQLYCMGGTGTIGAITGYYFGAQGGLYTEIDEKAAALEGSLFAEGCHRDTKSLVLEREARACGAELRYNCLVTGVYLENKSVKGLRLYQNGRETNAAASQFIDATGEAFVCHIAGCESVVGRAFDSQTQPFTVTSIAVNGQGKVFGINKDSGFVRQHDPAEVGRVMIAANNYPVYLKDDYSKTGEKFLGMTPLLGVREGRIIKGKKTLKFTDIAGLEQQEKEPLFYSFSNIDHHGKDIAFEDRDLCDWLVAAGLWGVLFSVAVPLGALIPDNRENIMAAGRCLSVDHNLASAVRMQRDMAKCGEAAACVCAGAVRGRIPLSAVKYDDIVKSLRANHCLDEKNNIGFSERVKDSYFGNRLPLLKTREEINEWLDSEKPGWGIWCAKTFSTGNAGIMGCLNNNLNSPSENLSRNTALAMGLAGNPSALGKLRQMAFEPDNYVPKSSLKYVYTRGVSAIYLLGSMNDLESVDSLFGILERRGQTSLENFTLDEFYCADRDVFSQYILFAARALTDMAEANPEGENRIRARLLEVLESPGYTIPVTLKENPKSFVDLKPKLVEYVKGARKNY